MVRGWARATELTLSLLAFAAACHAPLDPPPPVGAERFIAPPIYQQWWSMTSECSGASGSLGSIDWFVVPGVARFEFEGQQVSGYWSRAGNRIVMAERAMLNGTVVRHEMLHALQRTGAHERRAFLGRCGGVVICITSCLQEGGRPPVPRATLPRLRPEEMALDVIVEPAQPGARAWDGHFRLTVTVRNLRRDSVVVVLPPSGDAGAPQGFSLELAASDLGIWSGDRAWDSAVTVFGPGETHRAVFDFRLSRKFDGFRAVPPGKYEVLGRFGGAATARKQFLLEE